MKVLLSWLNEYGDFADPADPTAVERLADTMTGLGLAVEEIVPVGATVPGVVTARVLRTEQHPDAGHVQRVWVDRGDGGETHVWCGAFNFAPGDVVPLATLGTTMPNGMTIARTRGELDDAFHQFLRQLARMCVVIAFVFDAMDVGPDVGQFDLRILAQRFALLDAFSAQAILRRVRWDDKSLARLLPERNVIADRFAAGLREPQQRIMRRHQFSPRIG